jgi:initiation factor 1A
MPYNSKGGKNYKKGKKGEGESATAAFLDREPDQFVGRAIRLLGNRNILVFCNDDKLRICHVCGKMKGRVWIEPGDLVLCSLRQLVEGGPPADRGDIIGKYPQEQHSKLKREVGVNAKLFMKLETMEGLTLGEIGKSVKVEDEADCGFVIEDTEKELNDSDIDDI